MQQVVERIVRKGLDKEILRKRGNSRTFDGWLIQRIQDARKIQNFEVAFFLNEIRNTYLDFQIMEKVKLESWKGKSGVKFLIKPDLVIAERWRKQDKDSEPKKVQTELTKEEINKVIWAINKISKEEIKTSEIAELVYNKHWKSVFSTRKQHIKLVEILNYLEYREDIKYFRSGKIEVLKQNKLNEFKNG